TSVTRVWARESTLRFVTSASSLSPASVTFERYKSSSLMFFLRATISLSFASVTSMAGEYSGCAGASAEADRAAARPAIIRNMVICFLQYRAGRANGGAEELPGRGRGAGSYGPDSSIRWFGGATHAPRP